MSTAPITRSHGFYKVIVKNNIADCIGALGQRGVTGNCNGQAGPLFLVLVFH